MRLNPSLRLAAKIAEEKYRTWLGQKSRHTLTKIPPEKEEPSSLPKLIKGEFEKRAAPSPGWRRPERAAARSSKVSSSVMRRR